MKKETTLKRLDSTLSEIKSELENRTQEGKKDLSTKLNCKDWKVGAFKKECKNCIRFTDCLTLEIGE